MVKMELGYILKSEDEQRQNEDIPMKQQAYGILLPSGSIDQARKVAVERGVPIASILREAVYEKLGTSPALPKKWVPKSR